MSSSNKAAASRTLKPSTGKLITAWVVKDGESRAKKIAMLDQLHADGFKHTDFLSPNAKDNGSTCTKELWAQWLDLVISGLPEADQELLQKETKTLDDAGKHAKSLVRSDVGSRITDIKKALKKREDKAAGITSGPSNQRTPLQIIQDQITDSIERIANLDPENGDAIPDAMDLPSTTKHLKEALAAFLGK